VSFLQFIIYTHQSSVFLKKGEVISGDTNPPRNKREILMQI